jgi:hypothetical protein
MTTGREEGDKDHMHVVGPTDDSFDLFDTLGGRVACARLGRSGGWIVRGKGSIFLSIFGINSPMYILTVREVSFIIVFTAHVDNALNSPMLLLSLDFQALHEYNTYNANLLLGH